MKLSIAFYYLQSTIYIVEFMNNRGLNKKIGFHMYLKCKPPKKKPRGKKTVLSDYFEI